MSITIKRLKYVVTAVVVEIDEDGNITGEQQTEPQAIYSRDQMTQLLDKLDMDIERSNNGDSGVEP